MLDVAKNDRQTSRDWPYSEEEMRQTTAQRAYPATGRVAARRRQSA